VRRQRQDLTAIAEGKWKGTNEERAGPALITYRIFRTFRIDGFF
jgi:hypothetical protein